MPLPVLKYNDNEQEHRGFADTLGQAQGLILMGKLTRETARQNRIIVRLDTNGALVEGWAVAWRHDDRLLKLDDGFFKRAQSMRKLLTDKA
jgi:hypothetical protein